MQILFKILFLLFIILDGFIAGLLYKAVSIPGETARTINAFYTTLEGGLTGAAAGFLLSIFLWVKFPEDKYKKGFFVVIIILLAELIFLILGNQYNWWR